MKSGWGNPNRIRYSPILFTFSGWGF